MATTYTENGGGAPNGSDLEFTYTFPILQTEDIEVQLNGHTQATTKYTVDTTSNPTKITFNNTNIDSTYQESTGAPKTGVIVTVARVTTVGKTSGDDDPKAVFAAGSSIRAVDLNANTEQALYAIHELQERKVTTTKILDNSVTSAKILDDTIVDADINASAAIAQSKLNIANATTSAAGYQSAADKTKLDGIETGATTDQTASEIRTLVEAASDSNVFTDADHTKLNGIESGATGDQTATEIRTLVESASDSNVFTDADHNKLNAIEAGATADQTNAEIKTAYEANADTNEFSDAEQTKLAGIETAATADQTASEIKTLLQSDKLTLSEINTTSTDSRYFTETELTGGALDGRYYTETEAEAKFLRQDSSETIASGVAWSASDAFVATTAAIDARIVDLVEEVGGFVPLANETSFPTSNPDVNNGAGTIVSVQAASTNLVPSGTTVTIANGRGTGLPVILTGVSATIPSGFGFLVETTSTAHTYAFHRLTAKATEVNTTAQNITQIVACGNNLADIENFADLYQISTSAPTTRADGGSLTVGDLWFDSSSNQVMMVYDGSSGDGFSPITPDAATITAINSVSGYVTYSEDLGNITDAVNTGSGNNSINTVGAAIANVNTTATNIAKIQTVADDLNEGTSEIDTVATNITNVNNVGNNISNVNTVAGISANVTTVAGNTTNVTTLAGKATEIGRLGTADAVADMNTLGTTAIVSDLDTLADISSNITTVAGVSSNVSTVAGISANVTTVAGISGNVTTVANNNSNVTAVANNSSNINSAVSNASNINSAVSNAANINSAVSNATNINTVATNITNVNTFANRYRIASSAPSSSLDQGDLYFDTSSNELRVYNGSSWQGGVTATGNLAGLGANTFTGAQTFASGQTFDGRDVSADGSKLDAITTSSGAIVNGVTATTQSASDNSTKVATTAYVETAVSNLVDSAPGTLNTLNELAAALGDDANYATTTANSIATKAPLASPTFTGTVTAGTITGSNLTLDFGTL